MTTAAFKDRIAGLMGSDGIKHAPKWAVRKPTDAGYYPPKRKLASNHKPLTISK
jgi:hypothetical protein